MDNQSSTDPPGEQLRFEYCLHAVLHVKDVVACVIIKNILAGEKTVFSFPGRGSTAKQHFGPRSGSVDQGTPCRLSIYYKCLWTSETHAC